MKYQSEHGFTHPVLSPESDHYPNGRIVTRMEQPQAMGGDIRISIDFQIEESNLEKLISDGKARCVAMLYCRATLYQQTLQAGDGDKQIDAAISSELLRDAIEVHPLVVAAETIVLDTTTADDFFNAINHEVHEGEPLAADRGWHFRLEVDTLPLGSIFQFIPETDLTGPMQIELDPDQTYVNIRINADQLQGMNITRRQGLTIPSIFSAALVEAIHHVGKIPHDEPCIVPGWVDTIRKQADKYRIDLGAEDKSFFAAQILLGNPFADLPKYQMANDEEAPE